MMLRRPVPDRQCIRHLLLALLAAVAALALLPGWPRRAAFVGPAHGLALRLTGSPSGLRLRAEKGKDGKEIVDAETLDEDDSEEEFSDDSDEEFDDDFNEVTEGYPEEAYKDYGFDRKEDPPESWFERRYIDRHKVNMKFFEMYAKPKSFFPHDLQPGDTIRAFYMEPPKGDMVDGERIPYSPWKLEAQNMKETFFDGVIVRFKGQYHSRTMMIRTMLGNGATSMGMEMTIPIHSPLLTRINVLRRGYIGRNKNAYFIRAMIGKKNIIPLDKERTQMDNLYRSLKDDGRDDEIPTAEYPTNEWERYPLPTWWQDTENWDEAQYDADIFDRRSIYEKEVIAKHRNRIKPRIIKTTGKQNKKKKDSRIKV